MTRRNRLRRIRLTVRFFINILPTYFPDIEAPYPVFYRQILEQVELAEELGWESFWFTEHHFLRYGGSIPNPAVFLAAAAARTSRIRLGPCIAILPLRHPLQTAEDYAMVDAVSNGRLDFGIGLGNTDLDYRVYGVARDESRARFEEAAEVIGKVWSRERCSHQGEFWRFEEISIYPRPVQLPHPPFWVAGTSAETLGWAGKQGYDIMTVAHPHAPESARQGVEAWRHGLIDGGHDPARRHCQLHARVWVDESEAKAREVAMQAISRYDEVSRIGRKSPLPPGYKYDWDGMLAQGRNIYGNPDQCIQGIHNAMRHYHFTVFTTTFHYGGIPHEKIVKAMRLFAREVMPAFR